MALFKPCEENVLGCFRNQHNIYFEFRKTNDEWALSQGCEYEIAVDTHKLDPGVRFAKIKKTVAYVAVDEDVHGNAVFEKMNISHFTGIFK